MRRVVVTGLGIVSCLGNNKDEVLASLKAQKSGIRANPKYAEMGCAAKYRHSANQPRRTYRPQTKTLYGRRRAYAYLSLKEAIADGACT